MGIIAMNYSDPADEPADDCGPTVKITLRLQKSSSTSGEVILGRRYGSGLIQAEGSSGSHCIGATINSFNTRMWIVHFLLCDSLQRL